MNPYRFYVYAYLREDGSPYYIGKGTGDRAYRKHRTPQPKDRSRIKFLERNLSEVGALAIERRMISWYGRKDIGTGILRNMSDGGEVGIQGFKHTESTKQHLSKVHTGKTMSEDCIRRRVLTRHGYTHSEETKQKIRATAVGRKLSEETKRKISLARKSKITEIVV